MRTLTGLIFAMMTVTMSIGVAGLVLAWDMRSFGALAVAVGAAVVSGLWAVMLDRVLALSGPCNAP